MRRMFSVLSVLVVGAAAFAAPSYAAGARTPPQDLVKQAVAAEGGADALRGLQRLAIKGEARHWEPEQSFRSMGAGGEPKVAGDSTFAVTWDIEKGMARTDWDRAMQIPGPVHKAFSEIVTPQLGSVKDASGESAMSGIRVATHLRELERASPTLLLKALDNPRNVRALGDQKLGSKAYPAVVFIDGPTRFIILFDPTTHLPAAVRTRDDSPRGWRARPVPQERRTHVCDAPSRDCT